MATTPKLTTRKVPAGKIPGTRGRATAAKAQGPKAGGADSPSANVIGTSGRPSRRWRHGPVNIGSFTERLTRPALGKRGFAGAEIISHWPAIVGAELAAFACPLQVKYPRGRNAGATLHLRVAHGAAAAMLQLKVPAIIARVNRFFGYDAVVQVQAAQGPMPIPAAIDVPPREPAPVEAGAAAAVEAQVTVIASEPLKEALTKLGLALQHRARTRRYAGKAIAYAWSEFGVK